MGDALDIFTAGLGGVFVGMTLLYLSIRVTGFVLNKWFHETGANE